MVRVGRKCWPYKKSAAQTWYNGIIEQRQQNSMGRLSKGDSTHCSPIVVEALGDLNSPLKYFGIWENRWLCYSIPRKYVFNLRVHIEFLNVLL